MSIAASWPGQRVSLSTSSGRFQSIAPIVRFACDGPPARGLPRMQSLRPLPGPAMLRTDLDPLPRPRIDPEPPGRGFARAVQPITAAAIATGTEGLVAGPVMID